MQWQQMPQIADPIPDICPVVVYPQPTVQPQTTTNKNCGTGHGEMKESHKRLSSIENKSSAEQNVRKVLFSLEILISKTVNNEIDNF